MRKNIDLDKLLERMIEEVTDYSIFLVDHEGKILTWNKGSECVCGHPKTNVLGRHYRICFGPQEQQEKTPEYLLEEASKEGSARYMGKLQRKENEFYQAHMVVTAIRTDQEEFSGFNIMIRETREDLN